MLNNNIKQVEKQENIVQENIMQVNSLVDEVKTGLEKGVENEAKEIIVVNETPGQDLNVEGNTILLSTEAKEQAKNEVLNNDTLSLNLNRLLELAVERSEEPVKAILELRNTIVKEKAISAYNESMSLLLQEIPVIKKDKVVRNKDGSVRYQYSSYENMIKVLNPLLSKYGFSYRFDVKAVDGNTIEMVCFLKHIGGHTESASIFLPLEVDYLSKVHSIGALLSYGKRYLLSLLLGIAAEDDIDYNLDVIKGEAKIEAVKEHTESTEHTESVNSEVNKVNNASVMDNERYNLFLRKIHAMLSNRRVYAKDEHDKLIKDFLWKYYQVKSTKELKPEEYSRVISQFKDYLDSLDNINGSIKN